MNTLDRVVLALVIGVVFSWRLTGPIHELIQTTRRIAGGDFGRRAKVHGNNEIATLADHFNAMSETIGKTIDDLKLQKELNDQLFLSSIRSLAAIVTGVSDEVRDGLIRVELSVAGRPMLPLTHGLPGNVEIEVEHVRPARLVLRTLGGFLTRPVVTDSAPRAGG